MEIPETYSGLPIVEIGDEAFSWCRKISTVIIPNTIKVIGDEAFYNSSIQYIDIPASVEQIGYGISYESQINSISVADDNQFYSDELGVLYNKDKTEIVNYPCGKDDVTTYFIPDSVTTISPWAFAGRNNLEYVHVPDTVTEIGDYAFFGSDLVELDVPNGIREINHQVYSYCYNLKTVTIYNNVEVIGDNAFSGSAIESVTIPSSVQRIQSGAFRDCTELENVKIADGLKVIMGSAFSNCSSLVNITIPASVNEIENYVFDDCSSLVNIYVSDTNKDYADINGVLYRKVEGLGFISLCKYPEGKTETSYDITENVGINNNAFYNAKNLERVTINGRVGSFAFSGCSNLSEVVLTKRVTGIEQGAFYNCPSLKSVTIPSSVTYICPYSSFRPFGYYEDQSTNLTTKVEDFIIYGVSGTAAETYASENEFQFVAIKEVCSHVSTDWLTDTKATVYAAGSQHKECTVCGEVLEREAIPQLKPAAPKLTSVTNSAKGATVKWGAVEGADNYNVYRKTYNATTKKWSGWSRIKKGTTSTSFTDTTAKSGTYYRYTVIANNEAGSSKYDTTGLKIYFLSTPKLTSIANNTGKVTVKWGKVSGATGYFVYRRTYNATTKTWGGWTRIAKTKSNAYNDTTAKSGVYYRYTVRAYYSSYTSYFNTTGLQTKFLATPTLKAATSTKAGVKVTWGKVSGAKAYDVYRSTYSNGKWSGWSKIATTKSGSIVAVTDKTAKKGVTYRYTVRAKSDSYRSYYNTKGLQVKDKY